MSLLSTMSKPQMDLYLLYIQFEIESIIRSAPNQHLIENQNAAKAAYPAVRESLETVRELWS